jgi:hypothetical protein
MMSVPAAGVSLNEFIAKVDALVQRIHKDEYGIQVGNVFVGGNGGMISRETLLALNELTVALDRIKNDHQRQVTL